MAKQTKQALQDWRSIADDREKYQAYLCSREWAEKREAVRKRAGDKCERCKVLPIDAVHHLTYARKYEESLDDLQAICQPCHDFTHGKSASDPSVNPWNRVIRYGLSVLKEGRKPCPFTLLDDVDSIGSLKDNYLATCMAMRQLYVFSELTLVIAPDVTTAYIGDIVLDKINELLPFDYAIFLRWGMRRLDQETYKTVLTNWLGLPIDGDYWAQRD